MCSFMASFIALTIFIALILTQLYIWKFSRTRFYQKHKDLCICAIITLVYAAYAFTNLGNFHSPQSYFHGTTSESIEIDFGEIADIHHLQFMQGPRHEQVFLLEFSYDAENWGGDIFVGTGRVFAWDIRTLIVQTRYIRLTPLTPDLYIMEMGFRDGNFNIVPITNVDAEGAGLFDEQHLIPNQPLDYMHSTYFDEVFYARTAYEYLHGMEVYEWTHPPLGKVIISWGIRIFGMTPFGWRFMGALAGVLMLIPLYYLARALFKSSFWAGFSTIIFAFDFMHYVLTRVAMIDTFAVLFMIAVYYFMYQYSRRSFLTGSFANTLVPLLFSGIFMGLSVATKWSGLYGAAGIAVLFFIIMLRRYKEYKTNPVGYKDFPKYVVLTFVCCVVFFVFIPATIYILSYIPYYRTGSLHPEMGFLPAIFQNQIDMLHFHLHIDATHLFASYWWEWVINWRPMLFFDSILPDGMRQGISAFGNPVVWWGGIPALVYTCYRAAKGEFVPTFLVVGYLAFLLPWLFAARVSFIYYYFPSVVFLVLMIAYAIREMKIFGRLKLDRHAVACTFATVAIALFLLFYPVLAGVPISTEYVERFLRWPFMREWILIV